jgi:hypothetical protein
MKQLLAIAISSLLLTAGLTFGQTASFSFNDNNGTPDAGTYNPTDTFNLGVYGTATGFTANGFSLWLEVPTTNGFNAAIMVTGSTVFQFTDKTESAYPKVFTDTSGQRSTYYLTDQHGTMSGDLGATANSSSEHFTGTARLASYTFSLNGAALGTYIMYTTSFSPKKSGISDTNFDFLNAAAVACTITVILGTHSDSHSDAYSYCNSHAHADSDPARQHFHASIGADGR